jgi:hypothetical protein
MSIPLRARGIDLLNLVVGKGSNFLLTVILFSMASYEMDPIKFSDFGYWWSIGIMVGGVFLGGMSSAAVRNVAITSSLRLSFRVSKWLIAIVMLSGLLLSVLLVLTGVAELAQVLLVAAVSMFGICVMLQGVVFGLLRALEATRFNTIASAAVVILVPGITLLLAGSTPDFSRLFGALAVAFLIGTVVCVFIAWPTFRYLLNRDLSEKYDSRRIVRDTLAFTALNIFSYAAVNVDFTLIKFFGTQDEFVLLASGKVYFERFVLPVLMVFAGAVSLRVLRHTQHGAGGDARIEAKFSFSFAVSALLLVTAMASGYWVFSALLSHDLRQLSWMSAIAASIGYLLFAFNAVLLDVLVLRVRIRTVLVYVFAFVILGGTVQLMAFMTFRVSGWSLGWLAFNTVVTVFLALECLHLKDGVDTVGKHIK